MVRILLLLLAAAALALWVLLEAPSPLGPARPVELAQLLADPGAHDGQKVTVRGTVEGRASVLGIGGVRLTDGQGHGLLVAGWTAPPQVGTQTTLTGRFVLAFTAGRTDWPILIMEDKP